LAKVEQATADVKEKMAGRRAHLEEANVSWLVTYSPTKSKWLIVLYLFLVSPKLQPNKLHLRRLAPKDCMSMRVANLWQLDWPKLKVKFAT
jgi:hypothetical protein